MAVNEALAVVSNLAFEAAMAAYLTALVCYGIEFAARRSISPTAAEAASARLREFAGGAVGVLRQTGGEPAAGQDWAGHIGALSRPRKPLWGQLFGRAAVILTVLGFTAQLISLITRGLAVNRAPWGNMYEFTSMITAAAVGCWLIVLVRTRARSIGFFVMLPVVILVFVAGTVLYVPATQLVPALQSYWLVIHVLTISLSSGVLMLSGAASVVYLLRARLERRQPIPHHPASSGDTSEAPQSLINTGTLNAPVGRTVLAGLPSLATLDRVAYRTAIVAFPVYTFSVMAGALWAEAAWGRYWGWDPKETTAFITWVVYAGYLHARATAGWRGRRAAWISVIGFVSIVFNLFFINMVVSGLHSYAGLN